MVACHGHRPCRVPCVQAGEKTRRIVHITARIEHLRNAAERSTVIVVIDLHAAEIDQFLSLPPRIFEFGQGLRPGPRKHGFSLNVQGVRLQASFLPRLRQSDGVENAGGDAVAICRPQDLRFARIGGSVGGERSQAR